MEQILALPGHSTAECTVDQVTGLVWESKDASTGPRRWQRGFTHLDRTDRPQVLSTSSVWLPAASAFETLSIPRTPTQGEVDSSDIRHGGHMVFQIQLAKRQDAVPLTRDYITDWERRGFDEAVAAE